MVITRGIVKGGFTLIELLISIAIISLLTALLVPTIDRSLSRNNLANDVDMLRSKIEETRLMAGSTQQADSKTTGYYAVFFPTGSQTYFSVIRVDDTTTDCTISTAAAQASTGGPCLVERVALSKNVTLENTTPEMILFRAPTQQVSEAHKGLCGRNGCYTTPGSSTSFASWNLKLQFKSKAATVKLDDYTGKLSVTYN